MQGKGDLLGAHIDAWFESPEFKKFVNSAKIFKASPIRKNLQDKEEKFFQIGMEADKEAMDIVNIINKDLKLDSEPLPMVHMNNQSLEQIQAESMDVQKKLRELDHQAYLINKQRDLVLRSPAFNNMVRNASAALNGPASNKFGNALGQIADDLEESEFKDVFNVSDLPKWVDHFNLNLRYALPSFKSI